jgi:hypothetical protein
VKNIVRVAVIIVGLQLSACSTLVLDKPNNFFINEIVIHNSSDILLEKAKLKVSKSYGLFSCSNIIPHTACSTTFPVRPYEGNWVKISWQKNGKEISTENIHIPVDKEFIAGSVMKAIIEIQSKDKYRAYFKAQSSTY